MCVFNAFFDAFGTFWLRIMLEKIFLDARETKCWTDFFSYSHDFHFCRQHVSLRLIHLCPKVFGKVSTLSTDSWWHFTDSCFRKDTICSYRIHNKDVFFVEILDTHLFLSTFHVHVYR